MTTNSVLKNYYNEILINRCYPVFCSSELNSTFSKFNDATELLWVEDAASYELIVKGAVEC